VEQHDALPDREYDDVLWAGDGVMGHRSTTHHFLGRR
jgi:hypothetical protein